MAKRRVEDYEDSDEYNALKRAIGKRIRTLRIARGLSAKSLSDLAEISSTNFGVIESGYGNVTLLSLDRIAKALVVPLASLFEDPLPLRRQGSRAFWCDLWRIWIVSGTRWTCVGTRSRK